MRKNCCSAYHRSFIVGTMYVCIRNRHPENFRLFSAFSWTQGCSSTRHHQGYSWKMGFLYKMGEIQFWDSHAQFLPSIVSLLLGSQASKSSQVILFQFWSWTSGLWILLLNFFSDHNIWLIRAIQLHRIYEVLRSSLYKTSNNRHYLSKWNVYCLV